MDRAGAEAMLLKELNERVRSARGGVAIVDGATIDLEYGWAFFYNSRHHLETGELSSALVGQGVVIVDTDDGSMHFFGSGFSAAECIAEYTKQRASGVRDSALVQKSLDEKKRKN
jgi:hypothetical protein